MGELEPAEMAHGPGGQSRPDEPASSTAGVDAGILDRGGGEPDGGERPGVWRRWRLPVVAVLSVFVIGAVVYASYRYWSTHRVAGADGASTATSRSALAIAKGEGEQAQADRRIGPAANEAVPADPLSAARGTAVRPAPPLTAVPSLPAMIDGGAAGKGSAPLASRFDAPMMIEPPNAGDATVATQPPKVGPQESARRDYTLPVAGIPTVPPAAGAAAGTTAPRDERSMDLKSQSTPLARARLLGDRRFMLAKGAVISCVMNTALDSGVPGMTSCTVTRNVYSDDGNVVLVERGSVVTGEYRRDLAQGQSRLAILWNRIRTPNGVVVDLDSPGTDALGRAGAEGVVNNHWAERLGAALLVSFLKDAIAYETAARAQGAGGAVVLSNTQQSGASMADTMLKGTLAIAPTLTVAQGERMAIFVARDLDFSAVYGVRLSRQEAP